MWSPLQWFKRDREEREGRDKARAAIDDVEVITRRIDEEISKDRVRARVLRDIREHNHLAELFDEAFSSQRRREGS